MILGGWVGGGGNQYRYLFHGSGEEGGKANSIYDES